MPIRLRLAVVVAVVSAALLGLGGFVFVGTLGHSLVSSLDARLTRRARSATKALGYGGQAGYRRPTDGDHVGFARRLAAHQGGQLVQAVSPSGHLVDLTGTGKLLLSPSQLASARRRRSYFDSVLSGSTTPLRLLAAPVASPAGWVVVVGASLGPADDARARVEEALLLAGGPVVLLAACGAWFLGGAALAPVERMRRRAAAISEDDTSARLEVPATRDEVAALGRTMDDLIARLQAALERQRRFVTDAGHELRTPLAVLRAELELAAHPSRSREELAEAVLRAGEEAGRLSFLAEDLLVLASADEGHLVLHREATPIDALLEGALEAFGARARQRHVRLRLEAEDGLVGVIDRVRLRQALDNLLDNSLRVGPSGSSVAVVARSSGAGVVIEVADEGPGFPSDFLPHAFDRFRRADESRARGGGGAGLGLAIVQMIAVAHGGGVEAENCEGGGAVVRIRLPGPGVGEGGRAGPRC